MPKSTTFLVTHPCILPVAFAQRITKAQLTRVMQDYQVTNDWSYFTYAPYSQQLQRQLKASPNYCKRDLRIWKGAI